MLFVANLKGFYRAEIYYFNEKSQGEKIIHDISVIRSVQGKRCSSYRIHPSILR